MLGEHIIQDLLFLFLIFLMIFLAIVAGAHYELWLKRRYRRRNPRVLDREWLVSDAGDDWRGL